MLCRAWAHQRLAQTATPGDPSRLSLAVEVLEDIRHVFMVLPLLNEELCEVCMQRPQLPDGRVVAFPEAQVREYMRQVMIETLFKHNLTRAAPFTNLLPGNANVKQLAWVLLTFPFCYYYRSWTVWRQRTRWVLLIMT